MKPTRVATTQSAASVAPQMVVLPSRERFAILDPLRFLAAILVVAYHYSVYLDESSHLFKIFQFGYLGVNFFFMLSGFVITASAEHRKAWEFAISRASRLYPAFWCSLAFTLFILYFVEDLAFSTTDILLNASMLNDYFSIKNVDGVYWTLQAELKFYGCVFILLALNLFAHKNIWLLAWLLLAIIHHFTHQPFFLGWMINPSYSFYFIGGVCAYLLHRMPHSIYIHSIFACAMVFSCIHSIKQSTEFISYASEKEGYIAAFLIAVFYLFFYSLAMGRFRLQHSSLALLLGAISYPLYLIHNRAGKALIEALLDSLGPRMSILIVTAILIIIALLIHIIFEKPLSSALSSMGRKGIDTAHSTFHRLKLYYAKDSV